MKTRDRAILDDLVRFRCLTRDHVAAAHFAGLKRPVTQANMVLKRMRRDGYVSCSTERRKYVYFPVPSTMKKDSAKIPHFLSIADFYLEISGHQKPAVYDVEPKLMEKGGPEPDVFMIWFNSPFFVEIQRSVYSEKVMEEKFKRYETYFYSDQWHELPWQPKAPVFPRVWMLSEKKYRAAVPFKLHQTTTVQEFLQLVKK